MNYWAKGAQFWFKGLIIRGTWNYTRGITRGLCQSTFYRYILAHFSNAYSTSVSRLRAWLPTWNKGLYRRLVTLSCMGDPMDKRTRSVCTQEVSLYLFSRPVYTCICRWLTSSSGLLLNLSLSTRNYFPPWQASFSRGWSISVERQWQPSDVNLKCATSAWNECTRCSLYIHTPVIKLFYLR